MTILKHHSTMNGILYNGTFMLGLSKKIEEDWLDLRSTLPVEDAH